MKLVAHRPHRGSVISGPRADHHVPCLETWTMSNRLVLNEGFDGRSTLAEDGFRPGITRLPKAAG